MVADFTYLGMPHTDADGNVDYVLPFRSLQNPADQKYYKGVVDTDEHGQAFVYNKVPNNYSQETYDLLDSEGFALFDKNNFKLQVRG